MGLIMNEDYLYNVINDYADSMSDLSQELENLRLHLKNFIEEVKNHKANGHNELAASWILEYFH